MTRGQRRGALTTSELKTRLLDAFPQVKIPASTGISVLLGHAIYYKLLTDDEIDETTPRYESTLPCYLHTYVEQPERRAKLRDYAVVASKLFRRGSLILNRVAMAVCGPRLAGARDDSVSVLRPRWSRSGDWATGARAMAALLEPVGGRIEGNTLKHAFLPERWPSATIGVNDAVAAALASDPFLPTGIPSWRDLMSSTGWDNAVNRMMTKYFGNVKVHAKAQLGDATRRYMWNVPLHPDAPRELLTDAVFLPLRPIVVSSSDWEMAMDLRGILQGIDDGGVAAVVDKRRRWFIRGYTDNCTPEYSADVFHLHLFLTRFGSSDRSYLPVAKRSRKYAYVDAVVAGQLFGVRGRARAGESSLSVGELMGFTPEIFNRRRRELRRQIRSSARNRLRRHHRQALSSQAKKRAAEMRKRREKERRRWARLGASRMPRGARVDSFETDGVGLRLVMKTKMSMDAFIQPFAFENGSSSTQSTRRPSKKRVDKHPPPLTRPTLQEAPEPLLVALDLGRAKLFMGAISQSAIKKPTSMGFTRRQYYHEIGFYARRNYEQTIMSNSPDLQVAIGHLSESGGIKNCDPACWDAYLQIEAIYRDMLDEEFVDNDDRARWTMRLHRAKRRSLDAATQRLLKSSTTSSAGAQQPLERPLVIGVGAAGFSPNGRRGELPAPTSELSKALTRAIERIRATGRRVVTLAPDEFRTTKCCCACGAVTAAPIVKRRRRDKTAGSVITEDGLSRRLRCCTSCSTTGKLRDRDVQGARNILWLTYALYYDLERPEYMSRP